MSIPFFTFSDEFDITPLFKLRKEVNAARKDTEKITMLPFFAKAISLSLLDFPEINIHVNPETDENGYISEYIIKHDHNISIAIDTKAGLVVPNIKRIQDKTILQINNDILALRDRSNENKLTHDDLNDGTFSITSIGNIGGTYMVPTIFRPSAAILAIGRARKIAHYIEDEDKFVPRECVRLILTYR